MSRLQRSPVSTRVMQLEKFTISFREFSTSPPETPAIVIRTLIIVHKKALSAPCHCLILHFQNKLVHSQSRGRENIWFYKLFSFYELLPSILLVNCFLLLRLTVCLPSFMASSDCPVSASVLQLSERSSSAPHHDVLKIWLILSMSRW